MAKRMIDTNIFRKGLMRGSQAPYKLLWIYILLAVLFLGLQLFNSKKKIEEIDWPQFADEMVKNNEIEKIVVVNKRREIEGKPPLPKEEFIEKIATLIYEDFQKDDAVNRDELIILNSALKMLLKEEGLE